MSENYALPAAAELEAEAIHVLREAAAQFKRPALLASTGREAACLDRLAEAAFAPGATPLTRVSAAAAATGHDVLIESTRGSGGEAPCYVWDQSGGDAPAGAPLRIRPLADWSEDDIRHYAGAEAAPGRDLLRLVVAGAAGEGKSTLVEKLGLSGTAKRRFLVSDTSGGAQHTREVVSAASRAELAVLVVGAKSGLDAETKRHAFICSLLGIPRVVVAVNKMDQVGYAQARFEEIRAEFEAFAARLSFKSISFIPVSAAKSENVLQAGASMPWNAGETLLSHLENVYIGGDRNLVDLRFHAQSVVQAGGERWFLGKVASGVVKPGDEVVVLPSHRRCRVRALRLHGKPLDYAYAPLSVALLLDEDVDVGRGAVFAHARNLPHAVRALDAMVVWVGERPLAPGKLYLLKHGASRVRASCAEVNYRMDAGSLHRADGHQLALGDIGRASFTLFEERFVDPYAQNRATGGFVILEAETGALAGAGMIVDRESEPPRVERGQAAKRVVIPHASKVTGTDRAALLGQKGMTIWLTGLSGSGKSTLATELERELISEGRACYMLDGDNIRAGINRDLGFGPDDRRENIRRIAEVAKLMNDAGLITVTAFISPYRADRAMARAIIGDERFIEVFVDAPLDVCEQRDPKGLYRKARKGEIPEFTGITAPYEPPESPAVAVDTAARSIRQCVDDLLARILEAVRR